MGQVEAFLVLLGLFASFTHNGSGHIVGQTVKCIVCNSAFDKDCKDGSPEVLKKKYEVTCNENKTDGKNAYLMKIFGENLVYKNQVVLSPLTRRINSEDNSSVAVNCTCRLDLASGTCNTTLYDLNSKNDTNLVSQDSWLGAKWSKLPKSENLNDPCAFDPPRPLLSKGYIEMSIGKSKYTFYDACRKLVIKPAETFMPHGTKETEERVVRTCAVVQTKSNEKERTDKDLLDDSGCKDYKTKSVITNCLCEGINCNGSPKGSHVVSSRVILLTTSLPVLFYLLHK